MLSTTTLLKIIIGIARKNVKFITSAVVFALKTSLISLQKKCMNAYNFKYAY